MVRDRLFTVEACRARAGERAALLARRMQILAMVSGCLAGHGAGETVRLTPGQFCLFPTCLDPAGLIETDSIFLRIEAGQVD